MATFDNDTAKRIIEAVRWVEGQYRNAVPQMAGNKTPTGCTMLLVTTACNPISGGTPGTNGRGKVQKLVGSSYSDVSTTVYQMTNDLEKTVGVGAYCLCLPGPGGTYHIITVDKCSNLS